MRIRALSFAVLVLGILGLIIPIFLPPAPVLPNGGAFIPYILLGVALATTKSARALWFMFSISIIIVGTGTWAYWDGMRFNTVFSWDDFWSLLYWWVPRLQIAASLPVLGIALWRVYKRRKIGSGLK